MLNLERADAAVGHWALKQTQLMRVAATDRAAMQIGIMLTVRLTEWHQGELDRPWFTQELQKSPLNSDVKVPAASTIRRSFSRSREYFVEVLALGLMIAPSAAALAWTFYTPTRSGRRH